MNLNQARIEAILFTMGEPVSVADLALALEIEENEAKAAADALMAAYDAEERGVQILRLEDSYQMTTRKNCYETLIRLASRPRRPVLTDVQLETLAIIAYRQPVTKVDIAAIRGVNSDYAVNKLVEYGLVQEAGRKNAPGKPLLFTTTEEFLRRFQVESVDVLPILPPEQLEEIREGVFAETGFVPDDFMAETETGEEDTEDADDAGNADSTGNAEQETADA